MRHTLGQEQRSSGFGLLEVMITVGILSVLMASTFGFLEMSQRSSRSSQLSSSWAVLETEVKLALSHRESCNALLKNLPGNGSPTLPGASGSFPIPDVSMEQIGAGLKYTPERPLAVVGQLTDAGGVRIKEIRIQSTYMDLGLFGSNERKYLAEIRVLGEKPEQLPGKKNLESVHYSVITTTGDAPDYNQRRVSCEGAESSPESACSSLGGIYNPTQNPKCLLSRLSIASSASTRSLAQNQPAVGGIFTEGGILSNGAIHTRDSMEIQQGLPTRSAVSATVAQSGAAWMAPSFSLRRARGSPGAFEDILPNDVLGYVDARGYFNGAFGAGANEAVGAIQFLAAPQAWTDTSRPTELKFFVTPVGATNYWSQGPALSLRSDRSAVFEGELQFGANVPITEAIDPLVIADPTLLGTASGGGYFRFHGHDLELGSKHPAVNNLALWNSAAGHAIDLTARNGNFESIKIGTGSVGEGKVLRSGPFGEGQWVAPAGLIQTADTFSIRLIGSGGSTARTTTLNLQDCTTAGATSGPGVNTQCEGANLWSFCSVSEVRFSGLNSGNHEATCRVSRSTGAWILTAETVNDGAVVRCRASCFRFE